MMARVTALLVYALSASVAFAATLDASLIQTSGQPSVGSGRFYGYSTPSSGPGANALSVARETAISEDVPIVVVWSNEDCSHCNDFIESLNANVSEVSAWLASREAVFVFFEDRLNDPSGRNAASLGDHASKICYEAWDFAANTCGAKASWPLFAFYYRRADGSAVKWGTALDRTGVTRTWANFAESYEKWVSENGITRYKGGEFAASGTEFDRYEAEAATKWVDVELVRETGEAIGGATNLFVTTWPDGSAVTNEVEWAKQEATKTVRVDIPSGRFILGESAVIALYGQDGFIHSTNAIYFVAKDNGNGNPLWIGERDADSLKFGEWTMDLDVATNKVAAAEGKAYTLVSVQGSLWCPDCGNADRNFMDIDDGDGKNRLRAWAASNNVALVAIDIPNYNGPTETNRATPSLLSRDAYATAIARAREWPASGADAVLTNKILRSGRGYLARKMVEEAQAKAMRIRNHLLVTTNTAFGGFHRPEDTNKNRTGVPIFVLLRKDGSVAARMTRFANTAPMAAERAKWDDYIKRFDEMLEIASSDASEIENNHWTTTKSVLTASSPLNSSVSHVDTSDVAVIADASVGAHVRLSVESESTNAVTLAIAAEVGGVFKTIASAYGPIGGLSVEADLTDAAVRWFSSISLNNTGAGFAVDETVSTMTQYALSEECYLQPQEKCARNVPDGDVVRIRVVEGELYRFAGLELPVDGLEDAGGGLYRATTSADLAIHLADGASEVEYQLWHPGRVEFAKGEQIVYTYMGDAALTLVRTGGVSGKMSETVRLLSADEHSAGRYVWTDVPVTWEDGEGMATNVVLGIVPPGDKMHSTGTLTFGVDDSRLVVTLLDSDRPGLELLDYDSVSTYQYFSSGISFGAINLLSGNHVSVRVLSGSLPQGTRLQYDETGGQVKLLGEPIAAGEYEFSVALAEIRDNGYVTGPASTIRVKVETVDDVNPFLSKARPNETLPLYMTRDGKDVVAGTLSVAITSRGRISARYAGTEAKSVAFSGSWQELDGESGVARAVFVKNDCILEMAMDKTGAIAACITLPSEFSYFADGGADIVMAASSAWPGEDSFDEYRGVYNVVFPSIASSRFDAPSGTGILSLRMATDSAVQAGRFTYSGFMPDGTPLNGSALAVRHSAFGVASVHIPVFKRVGKNFFSAVVAITPNAAENWDSPDDPEAREVAGLANGTTAVSIHRDTAWEYEVRHDIAVGAYYVPNVSPRYLSEMFYEYLYGSPVVHLLRFAADGVESPVFGALSVPEVSIVPDDDDMLMESKIAGMSFRYSPRSGVFTGSAVLAFKDENGKVVKKVTGSYRGILTPGWIRNCDCGYVVPEWYFGSGFLRYRDFNSDGRAVMKSLAVELAPEPYFNQ